MHKEILDYMKAKYMPEMQKKFIFHFVLNKQIVRLRRIKKLAI